jgi:hypothetical protein
MEDVVLVTFEGIKGERNAYFEVAKVDLYARLIWESQRNILIAKRLILDLTSFPHAATHARRRLHLQR